MAQQDEGIMAFMGADQAPPIDMKEFRKQAYPVLKDSVREVAPAEYSEMEATLSSVLDEEGDMDLADIERLLEIVNYINDHPEDYLQIRESLIAADIIDEEDFPPAMDVEFFATMLVVLQEALGRAQRSASEMAQGPTGMMPPQGFAQGGIAEAAQIVASQGRHGDTILAHITPAEAQMLKARGGSGTVNPATGLPEFFSLKKSLKKVGKAVKKVAASPIGRIALTVGLSTIMPPPLASALVTKVGGGSWKDSLKAAAVTYLAGPTSPIAKGVESATPFLSGMSPAVSAGLRSGITATGAALLTGSGLKEAVTAGITSGLTSGLQARTATPAGAEPVGDVPTADPQGAVLEAAPAAFDPAQAGTQPSDFVFGNDPSGFGTVRSPAAAPVPGATAAPGAVPDVSPVPPGATEPPSWWGSTKKFYNENISPSGIRQAGEPAAQEAGANAVKGLLDRVPTATPAMQEAAYQSAYKNAMPGMLAQYGPITAAGLGVMSLAGGFSPEEAEPLPDEERMRRPIEVPPILQKPIQNLPGVVYDSEGNITGSKPWNPYTYSPVGRTMPTEVATPGIMSLTVPSGYPNLLAPNQYNAGGLAALAQGGYPRRIGQISGPGTETSDDIPAMLSDGEFVFTARAVRGAGNGSRREGAKKMYAMMHQLEQNAARG